MPSLVLAGYVLVRPATSPPGMATVPEQIITISDCIQDDLPRPEFWDWFQDLGEACRAQSRAEATRVVAVALTPNDADQLMQEMGGSEQPFFELLSRSVPAPAEGLLGYELVGAEWTLDLHSWHCHTYADDLFDSTGTVVNGVGLFDSFDAAQAGLSWMTGLPLEQASAPVPWFAVALFEMPSVQP